MRRTIELRVILGVLVAIAFGGVTSLVLGASQPTTSADVLAALLIEVKGLRAALEQMSSASGRIQLSVARLQIEEIVDAVIVTGRPHVEEVVNRQRWSTGAVGSMAV